MNTEYKTALLPEEIYILEKTVALSKRHKSNWKDGCCLDIREEHAILGEMIRNQDRLKELEIIRKNPPKLTVCVNSNPNRNHDNTEQNAGNRPTP